MHKDGQTFRGYNGGDGMIRNGKGNSEVYGHAASILTPQWQSDDIVHGLTPCLPVVSTVLLRSIQTLAKMMPRLPRSFPLDAKINNQRLRRAERWRSGVQYMPWLVSDQKAWMQYENEQTSGSMALCPRRAARASTWSKLTQTAEQKPSKALMM